MRPSENQRGSLDTIEILNEGAKYCAIILHGYGADASDLFPLHQVLSSSKNISWIFPNAPLEIPFGGRAWFEIDAARLNAMFLQKSSTLPSFENPKGLQGARNCMEELLENIQTTLNISGSNIFLGGFSQGAMMAVDTALRTKETPAGLLVFSGATLNEEEWKSWTPKRQGLSFFQSHGMQDPILPIALGKNLSNLLQTNGLKGQLQSFSGGHEIPMEILKLASSFLTKRLL